MSLLLLLTGGALGGQGIPPEPEPEPEEEAAPVRSAPGGALGRGVMRRRREIAAVTREYRDAEDELLLVALL